FLLTSKGNPDPNQFPRYMVQDRDNLRGQVSRQILSTTSRLTFDEWRRAAFDTRVISADQFLPTLLDSLNKHLQSGSTRKDSINARLAEAKEELMNWNHRSTIDSVAMTLFTLWRERMSRSDRDQDSAAQVAALRDVLDTLERSFGTWRVPWGEINRL